MNADAIRPYFLLSILVGAAVLVFLIFKPFLVPLSLAAIFAVVLRPVYLFLLRKIKGWPASAALITILLALVCVMVPLALIGVRIVEEARQLATTLSDGSGTTYFNQVVAYGQALAERYIPGTERFSGVLASSVDTYAKGAVSWIVANGGALFSGLTQTLFSLFIFLIALFYMLRDGADLRARLISLSPLTDSDDNTILDRLEQAVGGIVKGNLTLAFLQGALSGLGLYLFGVPSPVLWGLAAGLAALVPGLGTALVLVPAALYLLITGALGPALGLLLWAVLAVGLIDNFLGPKLVGNRARLHPLMVLFSVLGGVALFGPAGLFLGPLCSSLFLALLSIYARASA
ncbi:MAG: hypothetical protein JWL87_478 [Candidatus Adlerbacteria bacterium]|nr:hypothetical protein [Candidatus Adlerbacteria bacterium]